MFEWSRNEAQRAKSAGQQVHIDAEVAAAQRRSEIKQSLARELELDRTTLETAIANCLIEYRSSPDSLSNLRLRYRTDSDPEAMGMALLTCVFELGSPAPEREKALRNEFERAFQKPYCEPEPAPRFVHPCTLRNGLPLRAS